MPTRPAFVMLTRGRKSVYKSNPSLLKEQLVLPECKPSPLPVPPSLSPKNEIPNVTAAVDYDTVVGGNVTSHRKSAMGVPVCDPDVAVLNDTHASYTISVKVQSKLVRRTVSPVGGYSLATAYPAKLESRIQIPRICTAGIDVEVGPYSDASTAANAHPARAARPETYTKGISSCNLQIG
jgi:hypothetical protein